MPQSPAGSGNAALVAARRYCDVTGVDYVPTLIERARKRAAAEGSSINFREGDAQALPVEDSAFDVVLSVFGAMFAPDQARTAGELLRACRQWREDSALPTERRRDGAATSCGRSPGTCRRPRPG